MSTTATTERLATVSLPRKTRRAKLIKPRQYEEEPLTKEQFLQILKEGDERFARGEYKTEDEMWALIDRLRVRVHEHYNQ